MMPGVSALEHTLPGAFLAAAHRHRGLPAVSGSAVGRPAATWGDVTTDVRVVALGLRAEGGPAPTVGVSVDHPGTRLVVELAVLAAAGAVALDVTAADVVVDDDDVSTLREAGRTVDDRAPDRFERTWQAVEPATPALIDGDDHWTHESVLWGARSVAQEFVVDADDRVAVALPPASAVGFVVGAIVPSLRACSVWVAPDDDLGELVRRAHPTVIVTNVAGATMLGAHLPDTGRRFSRHVRRRATALAEVGLAGCRTVAVVEHAAGTAAATFGGIPAGTALAVAGYAGLVLHDGRPLPGVTVAVDDDGRLLVRGDAAAADRCVDGWLPTGLDARIDDGRVILGPRARAS